MKRSFLPRIAALMTLALLIAPDWEFRAHSAPLTPIGKPRPPVTTRPKMEHSREINPKPSPSGVVPPPPMPLTRGGAVGPTHMAPAATSHAMRPSHRVKHRRRRPSLHTQQG